MVVRARTYGLIVLIVATSASAFAQTNEAIAEKLFREAQEAMKARHYAEACAKFDASNRADPQRGTLLNLAACHEAEGKPASAWNDYATLVDLATKAHDDGRADYARKRVAALEPTLPQLQLEVPSKLTLTEVVIDDHAIAPVALATSIPVDPGKHTLAFTSGTTHWTQEAIVGETGKIIVEVRLPASSSSSHEYVVSPPPVSVLRQTSSGNGLRTAGGVLLGVGAATTIAAIVFGVVAIVEKSKVDAECNPNSGVCSSDGYDASVATRTTGWASTGLFVGSVALVATGIVFFVLSGKTRASPAASRGLSIVW